MKNIIIFLSFIIIIVLTGCKSNNEIIAYNYIINNDFPCINDNVKSHNGEIIDFSISDFNDCPIDTLYKWEVYEMHYLRKASNTYANDLEQLTDYLNYRYRYSSDSNEIYYDSIDIKQMIKELSDKLIRDSIIYDSVKTQYGIYRGTNAICAYGYEFIEKVKIKYGYSTEMSCAYKIIYIEPSGKVFNCTDADKNLY